MLSARIGALVRDARRRLAISQPELARRTGVSTRLVREVERGERPNVSLETALRLLYALGVASRFTSPDGSVLELRGPSAAALERAARAARRRASWTGTQVPLERSDEAPDGGRSAEQRLAAVAQVSRSAATIARAARARSARTRA